MCKEQGIPSEKRTIVSAVKNVSSALQLASRRKGLASTICVRNPSTAISKDIDLADFKKYQIQRNQEKLLVATIDSNAKEYLDIPCLVVTSEDINGKDFSEGLGRILLEP